MPDSVEKQFRKIFDYTNDAIFIIDPARNTILEANPRACTMLGYSREELVALHLSVLCPRDALDVQTFARSVFEYGQGWTNALPFVTKTGQPLPAEMSAASIDLDGVPCLIILVRDASAIRQVEQALRQVSDELEQVVEEKTFELRKAHEILQEQAASRSVAEKALRKVERELRQFQKMSGGGKAAGPHNRRPPDESPRR
jgi:PAS domain S-box-containing protein